MRTTFQIGCSLFFCWILSILSGFGQEEPPRIGVLGVSAISLNMGEVELALNGSFNLKRPLNNIVSPPFGIDPSRTFDTGLGFFQATVGVTNNKWLNVGLDAFYTKTFNFQGFEGATDGLDSLSNRLSIGPRIRWRPFGNFSPSTDIAIQNSALFDIPIKGSQIKGSFPTLINELIITQYLMGKYGAFGVLVLQGGFNVGPIAQVGDIELDKVNPFTVPISLLSGWYIGRNVLVFVAGRWVAEYGSVPWGETEERYRRRSQFTIDPGVQLSFNNAFMLSVIYSRTLPGLSEGDYNEQGFTFGIRYLFGGENF